MPRTLVALLSLLLVFGCEPFGADREPPSLDSHLLPLSVGNRWTFVPASDLHSSPAPFVLSVLRTKQIDDRTYFGLGRPDRPPQMWLREGDHGRVYRYRGDHEELWLDPSPSSDSPYTYGPYEVRVTRASSPETPAGTFYNGLRFSFDIPRAVDDEHSYTLAPGIGFIRRGGAWIGRWELASYRLEDS